MNIETIRIASRNSPLALKQSEGVKAQLEKHHPSLKVDIIGMTTEGDKRLSMPLATVGGKGLFVKELEEALLANNADIAVHSMKDVPVYLPDGLILPVICKREDPRDVFVSKNFANFFDLPRGSCIGTASLRRQCQVKTLRSDLDIKILRGNIQTRLRKLAEGEFDGIILAAAGLKRMGLDHHIRHSFLAKTMIPAVGQGALGIECRADDTATINLIANLQDDLTTACVSAERALNQALEGGCQVPIGAYAFIENDTLNLSALVGKPDGSKCIRANASGAIADAVNIGKAVAEELLNNGAGKILEEVYLRFSAR